MYIEGISVGEIGPKLGLNSNDNGYLGFDKVRIPRDQLLMKHSQVLEVCPFYKPILFGRLFPDIYFYFSPHIHFRMGHISNPKIPNLVTLQWFSSAFTLYRYTVFLSFSCNFVKIVLYTAIDFVAHF